MGVHRAQRSRSISSAQNEATAASGHQVTVDVPFHEFDKKQLICLNKQDGNHEPESFVLRRWIDHNKMTVHLSVFFCDRKRRSQ